MIDKIKNELKQSGNFLNFMGIKIIGEIFTFIIPLFIAILLKPEIFGSFSLFKMIIFFGTAVFIGPIVSPFIIESNKEYSKTKKSNKTFTSVLIYTLSSIFLFLIIYLFFGKEMIHFTGLDYQIYKYVFILAFLGLTIKSFFASLFLSQDKRIFHVIIEFIYPTINLIYIYLLYQLHIFNLHNIFLGYFLSGVFIFIISVFLIDYKRIFPLSYSKENFREIIRFGSWVVLGYVSSYLINWGDNLVLKSFVPLSEIGIYNLAYQIFKGGIMISFMINTYYTPFVSKNVENKQAINEYLYIKRPKILKFIFGGIIFAEIFVGFFIRFFFDSSYYPTINILRVLLPSILIAFDLAFYFPIFNSIGKYKINQLFIMLQISLNIFFDIIFITYFGVIGAAIGTTLAYTIYGLSTRMFFYKKIFNNSYRL